MENKENPNLIELLRQALLFYADERNYEQNKNAGGELTSLIEVDNGSQARFALSKIREFNEASEKLEADYMKNMHEAIEGQDSPENVLKIIEGFKNIAKRD